MLFRGANACVSVNGKLTRKFPIHQGVRQGCPLAPYLFLIIGEVLNLYIKAEVENGRIRGIILPGTLEQQTTSQYADDSSLTLRRKKQIVSNAALTLNLFSVAFGLHLNWEKSNTYWWKYGGEPQP
jgi:hypothetical protein